MHDEVREAASGTVARFAVGLTDGISKLAVHAILAPLTQKVLSAAHA
ncbi:hypothetical protein OKW26_005241 [Paraburkholderia sp. 32]